MKTDINTARQNLNSGKVAYLVGKRVWRIYGSTDLGHPAQPYTGDFDDGDEAEAFCAKEGLMLVSRTVASNLVREWQDSRAFALRLFVSGKTTEALRVLGKEAK